MSSSVGTLQTIWDCHWSRPGHLPPSMDERPQPDNPWVCVRTPGRQRPVTKEECEECGFWENEEFVDMDSCR